MEAVVQGFSGSVFDQNPVDGFKNISHTSYMDLAFRSEAPDSVDVSTSPSSGVNSAGDAPEEGDSSDATLKLITQMLLEEDDLEHKPCMFQQCLALQATEKSFYDALGEKYPSSPPDQHPPIDLDPSADSPDEYSSGCASVNNFTEPNWIRDQDKLESSFHADYTFESVLQSISSSNGSGDGSVDSLVSPFQPFQVPDSSNHSQPLWFTEELVLNKDYVNYDFAAEAEKNRRDHSPNGSREKKTHHREDGDYADGGRRSNKQLASYAEEESDEQLEMFDEVLLCSLCSRLNPHLHQENRPPKESNGGKARGKKKGNTKEVVDLRTLLSQSAQAVASADFRSATELLKRIKQHSSPYGDGTERLAHYFADALEARLVGTGTPLYAAFTTKRISAADMLKAFQVYVKASPYNKISNGFAKRSIGKLAQKATSLHIIDFGILYGFQWPCLIQHLSLIKPGGPPKLCITGIDFPQPGFRPAERVEDTGRRLRTYCQRFNVPFEYTAIAKKWDTIELEDLKIDRDEVLVVNCLFRLRNVTDETMGVNSSRDAVLNLVKRINPDLFIHGVVNGTYNAPFFVTRFREALFHFSAAFDMFEATVPREDQGRMMFEKEVLGRDVMNVVACEGSVRVERPETYKQWQVRNVRAGFRQLPLDPEIMKDMKAVVKSHYHKDFMVAEDGNWMLQGWKGRIVYALSCWKPVIEL